MKHQRPVLFLLQQSRRFLAQDCKKTVRCLRQQPRQGHFYAQRVFDHFNSRRRSLAERAYTETQRVSFPSLLLNRDHRSEVTVGAGEALFDTANRLTLSEAMADDDRDGFAHGSYNLVTWTCMRAILIERRSWQPAGGQRRSACQT